MHDAFGVARPDLPAVVAKSLVPGPGSTRRTLEASNNLGEVVPPAQRAKAKARAQWSKARADSSTGPALIGSSLDDVSKGMPDASEVHANAPTSRAVYRTQRSRDRRLRRLRTEAEPVGKALGGRPEKAVGETTGIRGNVSSTYKSPLIPSAKPDIKAIQGKLSPLKSAMVAATKVK